MPVRTIKRTCANCAAFHPARGLRDPACDNLVSVVDRPGMPQEIRREPLMHVAQEELRVALPVAELDAARTTRRVLAKFGAAK